MIKLQRNRSATAIPASFRGAKLRQKALALIDLYYAAQSNGGKWAFKSSTWKPAKGAMKRESHSKCAYCEASTETVAHGDVEHFRPKSIYWWLAFCFDNYLFACQLCNQTYKGDNFPLVGVAATAPQLPAVKPVGPGLDALISQLTLEAETLQDNHLVALWAPEDADLVNPYFEDPAPLFSYEVDPANEEIWIRSAGGDRADRAVAAAEAYLGLNRETLRRDRFAAYAPFMVFRDVLGDPRLQDATRRQVERQMRDMQRAQRPFSGMQRWFAAQWGLPGPL